MMGRRTPETLFIALIVYAFSWISLLGAVPEPVLTFPHLAVGPGVDTEINLTNPAPHIESGKVWFLDNEGNALSLMIDGVQTSCLDFSLPPGGARKVRIYGGDQGSDPRVGYAVVIVDNIASSLVGNIVFTLSNLFDISIPDSRPTTSARIFSERNPFVNSGYAVLNRGEQPIRIRFRVRNQDGQQIAETSMDLAPGHKLSGFLDSICEIAEFIGTLEVSADSPFYVLGLRQSRSGSLAASPAAVTPAPVVGSQLLYYLDTGINIAAAGYSKEALAWKTVYELTGIAKPANPTRIRITNNNRTQAVTLHLYFLNDQGRDYLDFLVVLPCGETLVFDPFDFEIPAVEWKTSNFLFGKDLPPEVAKSFPAGSFGTGRFLLSVVAVGAALDGDGKADILYPNEIAMINVCGVTTQNTGSEKGFVRENLHVFNAVPIAFDYLSGNHLHVPAGLDGPSFAADAALKELSVFTRTRVPGQNGFMFLQAASDAALINYMAGQKGPTAGTVTLSSTAVFTWGGAPFTFLNPGAR